MVGDGTTLIDRLAETSYFRCHDPECTTLTRFGRFVHIPSFPKQHEANQLFDVRCEADEVSELLEELELLYAPTGLDYRSVLFHDPDTARSLVPALTDRGWHCHRIWMMVWERPPVRNISREVNVQSIPLDDPDGHRASIYAESGRTESYRHRRQADDRIGGEVFIAYLEGEPVGHGGFFVVDGIARCRPVGTKTAFRNRGVGTTLVRHVQECPGVQDADALTLFSDHDGPVRLYEDLGFVSKGELWSCTSESTHHPD